MIIDVVNKVTQLLARLTTTRAGYLDKLNITGNVARDDNCGSTRMAKIDVIDGKMPASGQVPNTTEVPSASDYTAVRAGYLDNIKPPAKVQTAVSLCSARTNLTLSDSEFYQAGSDAKIDDASGMDEQYSASTWGSLTTILNYTGSGWLFGALINNVAGSTQNIQMQITVDGIVYVDTLYTSALTGNGHMVFALWLNDMAYLPPFPLRFDTSILVKVRSGGNAQARVKFAKD